jgi:hypothetical protein
VVNDVGDGSLPRRCALFGVRAVAWRSLLLDDDLTALRRLIVGAGARRVRGIVDWTRAGITFQQQRHRHRPFVS